MPSEKTVIRQESHQIRPVAFVLCRDCFWCAFFLGGGAPPSCFACSGRAMDFMPISKKEKYGLAIRPNGKVELDFAVA